MTPRSLTKCQYVTLHVDRSRGVAVAGKVRVVFQVLCTSLVASFVSNMVKIILSN